MNVRSCLAVAISLFIASAAIADEPKPVEKAMKRGERLLIAGDVDGAIAAYTEAIRLDPKNAQGYKERARTYAVKAAPERFPYLWSTWPDGVLDRQKHHDAKSLSDARKNQIADLTEAIRLAPNDFYTYLARADVYEEQGDLDKTILDCTAAIRVAPRHDVYYANAVLARAWLYGKKGDLDKAIADCTEVIRYGWGYKAPYVRCYRAGMYEKQSKLDKAVADYTEAVQQEPDNAYMYMLRARLYGKQGDLDKAIADCTAAILLKPDFAAARNYRGTVAVQKGSFDLAIADATEAIRLDPTNAAFYNSRSLAYAKKGDLPKAAGDRDSATRLAKKAAVRKIRDDSFEIVRNEVGELGFPDPVCSKYVPSVENGNNSHRFSQAQLKEMAKTSLDRGLFLSSTV